MADLPILSDEGAQQVEITQSSTQNKLAVSGNGSLQPPADWNGTGTITALNGTVVSNTNGCGSVSFNVTGTWVATLTIQATNDLTNWVVINGNVINTADTVQTFASNQLVVVPCGGFREVRLIATAFTSGTISVAWDASIGSNTMQVYSPVATSFQTTPIQATPANLQATVTPIALTKGTQGTTGFSVQDLKDAGRTYVTFTADAVAGVTSETLLSVTQNKQGTATTGVTNYTITNGKTLRIQSITFAIQSGSAIAEEWVRVKIRHNTAGATTTSSSLVLTASCGTNISATAATNSLSMPIPDGLEFYGNGTQTIGITHISSATTNVESVTICGYEY